MGWEIKRSMKSFRGLIYNMIRSGVKFVMLEIYKKSLEKLPYKLINGARAQFDVQKHNSGN